jgi:hypothetical protein
VNLGVASAQPVLTPGPAIFENEQFDIAFPKRSADGLGSMVRSMSTKRGRSAWPLSEDASVDSEVVNLIMSYTSSEISRASYFRANRTNFWRFWRDMVFPDGLLNVGTEYMR